MDGGSDAAAGARQWSTLVAEAAQIESAAEADGARLRLIGSLAIWIRCPAERHLLVELDRRPPRDLDFMGYARDERAIRGAFEAAGYVLHPSVSHSREWGVKRLIYTHPAHDAKADVFLDQLVMAHTIDFEGRLEPGEPTVSLADLLLSKLQIYRITRNDLIDLVVLLAEHGPGVGPGTIDRPRLEAVLGADWGFWYGALRNLEAVEEHLRELPLSDAVRAVVRDRVTELRRIIEDGPKTTRWKLRARVGTRAAWYEDVEDVDL